MAVKRSRTSLRSAGSRAATQRARGKKRRPAAADGPLAIQEVESLRAELDRLAKSGPARWNADPDEVRKSVLKLVLTLVEFIRQILERHDVVLEPLGVRGVKRQAPTGAEAE